MSTWEEELNSELNDVQKHKPPISASRVSSVTKLAYKHSKYANDIAFMIENFLELAKPEYKLAALYLIDSICKAKKQSDRDAYVKRFSQNIENTVNRVLDCTEKDKEAVKKVINLWVSQKVFNDNILQTVAQVMQQRIGVVPSGITINPVQPTVGFDAQALLATIASQTPSQPAAAYNFNSAGATTMPMNVNMPGQGMGASITNYANPVSYSYAAPIVTNTPIAPVATIQPRAAAQPLDNALFDIYDDLEDDEQRIAEQKKRREEEEQKRREEQERLSNLHNNQAATAVEQPAVVQATPAMGVPTPASVPQPQNQVPMANMPPNMHMQQPTGALNMPGAPFNQQVPIPTQQQGLPPPPNTYQPMTAPQQAPNMGRGGGYAPNAYGQFQPNPASGNFQQGMQQQGFQGGPNQFNNGPPQFNGQVPPNMQGKGPMGRGRGRGGFNNYAPDPANLPTGEPLGGNMLRNKSRILFVGNLSPAVTEEHLGKIYSKYSGEAKVRYLAPKHMAFVAFSDRALAEKAKEETQGKFLEGRDLKVGWAMEFKSDDFNRDTGESTVPTNAISMYRADQFVVLPYNPSDVIPLEEPRGRGRGFGRGGGDFNGGMGRGRGGFGRGRGLQSYDDNSHYGGGRNFQSQWSHPQQSGGDDGSDYSVKLTGGEDDKGGAKGSHGAGYGQYDNYYDSYYYGTGDQAEYYQQYYAAAGADPYAAAAKPSTATSSDDKNRSSGSGPSSRKRTRSRSRSRDRRRSRSRSRSRDRRSGGRRRTRSRSRSRSRDRDSKRRKL